MERSSQPVNKYITACEDSHFELPWESVRTEAPPQSYVYSYLCSLIQS